MSSQNPKVAKPNKGNKRNKSQLKQKNGRRSASTQKPKSDAISMQTMTDRRFNRVFTDPTFQSIPNKKRDTDKIQVDSRFGSMFTDPAFRTGYRIDKYGREVTNNEAYDLHKFYQLDQQDEAGEEAAGEQQEQEQEEDAQKTQTEGYDAEEEEEEEDDEEEDNEASPPKQTLNKAMQKRIARFKKNVNAEIDEQDTFWNEWKDEENEEDDDDTKNQKKNKLGLDTTEERLLNRKAGDMFAYEADSTSSSSSAAGSDYDYDRLDAEQVGEDVRAILEQGSKEEPEQEQAAVDCPPTKRIAVVNCDWDNLSAKDLFMIFRSFVPPEGSLQRVAIHPSEYGRKMMQKEDRCGPDADIWQKNELPTEVKLMEDEANFIDANEDKNPDDEDEEGGDRDDDEQVQDSMDDEEEEEEEEEDETTQALHQEMSKLEQLEHTIDAIKHGRVGDVLEDEQDTVYNKQALRKYELQKLRYYYAIVEFDSVATADRVYQELDGREYRHTCNVLNLSFVAVEFEAPFEPTDVCCEIPEQYTAASDRQCNALGSTYVDLSWDKTDPNRIESCQRAFSEHKLNEMDLDAYLQDDDAITDAGFDTDYPVTEYDTDTPDKKVLIKRRARNRYKDILEEFRTMEKNIRDSDDEDDDDDADAAGGAITDDGDDRYDNEFRINVGGDDDVDDGDESDDEDEDEDADAEAKNKSSLGADEIKQLDAQLTQVRESVEELTTALMSDETSVLRLTPSNEYTLRLEQRYAHLKQLYRLKFKELESAKDAVVYTESELQTKHDEIEELEQRLVRIMTSASSSAETRMEAIDSMAQKTQTYGTVMDLVEENVRTTSSALRAIETIYKQHVSDATQLRELQTLAKTMRKGLDAVQQEMSGARNFVHPDREMVHVLQEEILKLRSVDDDDDAGGDDDDDGDGNGGDTYEDEEENEEKEKEMPTATSSSSSSHVSRNSRVHFKSKTSRNVGFAADAATSNGLLASSSRNRRTKSVHEIAWSKFNAEHETNMEDLQKKEREVLEDEVRADILDVIKQEYDDKYDKAVAEVTHELQQSLREEIRAEYEDLLAHASQQSLLPPRQERPQPQQEQPQQEQIVSPNVQDTRSAEREHENTQALQALQEQIAAITRQMQDMKDEYEGEIEDMKHTHQQQLQNVRAEVGDAVQSKLQLIRQASIEIDALRQQIKQYTNGDWNGVVALR